ncbi:MAG: trypsin-like peptidase domain-containing protein [Phycisphaerae bacterium]|nr:trypsin-like peptidase domain-containing protein [Phycisphaerales bacterium]
MRTNFKSLFKQMLVFAVATVLAFVVLLKFGVIANLSYHIEKGRLQALRESMPASSELDPWNNRARHIAELVAPAVVQIVTERKFNHFDFSNLESITGGLEAPNHPLESSIESIDSNGFNNEGIPDPDALGNTPHDTELYVQDGYGSGFIVDAEQGFVVTNNHVIAGADTIHVYLPDGRRVDAVVRGADPKSDIAVLAIPARQLHELPIGNSESVGVGDDVLAVGNPFGLDGSFSRGIISAKSRSRIPIEGVEYRGFLQTDAVINPGNSGGPLINMQGEVIGINTAIATESGHYGGVGFAIPSSRVKRLLPALERGESVIRGYLGVSIASVEQESELARELNWDSYLGAIVLRILPDSPAGKYDLRRNDIILRINGLDIRDTDALINSVAEITPGTSTKLDIWREGKAQSLDVVIGQQPTGFTPRIVGPRE